MNKQIKQFAFDALKNKHAPFQEKVVGDVHCFDDEELIKFAELIVKECTNVCENYAAKVLKYSLFGSNGATDCAKLIKEHFGVEE